MSPLSSWISRECRFAQAKSPADAAEDDLEERLDRDLSGFRPITEDELREFSKRFKELKKLQDGKPPEKKSDGV